MENLTSPSGQAGPIEKREDARSMPRFMAPLLATLIVVVFLACSFMLISFVSKKISYMDAYQEKETLALRQSAIPDRLKALGVVEYRCADSLTSPTRKVTLDDGTEIQGESWERPDAKFRLSFNQDGQIEYHGEKFHNSVSKDEFLKFIDGEIKSVANIVDGHRSLQRKLKSWDQPANSSVQGN